MKFFNNAAAMGSTPICAEAVIVKSFFNISGNIFKIGNFFNMLSMYLGNDIIEREAAKDNWNPVENKL